MKYLLFIAIISFTVHPSFAQINSKAQEEIVTLENKWMKAMMQKDSIALQRIVAPEFELKGTGKRPPVSRAVWMQNTMQNLMVDSVRFLQIKVVVTGNVAVAKSFFFWQGAFRTEKFTDSTHLVDKWVKRNHAWQVVSRIVQE